MWTAVFIGIGIIFIMLGIIFRAISETKNNKGGRKKFTEIFSALAFFIGIFSLIAGVIFLVLTFSLNGYAKTKFDSIAGNSVSMQQLEPESASAAQEPDIQAEVIEGGPDSGAIEIAGAMASSEMKSEDGRTTYYASYAIDGDSTTCWQVSGEEENSVFTLFLKGKNNVSSVAFRTGDQAEGCYSAYNRPRIIRIDFPNGKYAYATLQDIESVQSVLLPEPVRADMLTITLVDFYPGENNCTCISEIAVY